MLANGEVEVKGYKVNYANGERIPFNIKVKPYPHPGFIDRNMLCAGIFNSANYIIYNKLPNGEENPLPEGSPLRNSGIGYGDQILWVDGEIALLEPNSATY